MFKSKYYKGILFGGALVMLPNCDLFKSECKRNDIETTQPSSTSANTSMAQPAAKSDSEVLLYLYDDKVPKLTVDDFQNYKKELLDAQPNYASIIEFMPNANEQIFESLVQETLIDESNKQDKIEESQEWKDDLEKIMKYARRSLNVKYYQQKHPVNVTDAEVKKYYDENKNNIPQLMISQGGVSAKEVMFDNKADAQAFYDKVKDVKTNFDALAKETKGTFKDLGEVNSQSFDVDGTVRKKVLEAKKFPSVELIEVNDKSFAVVKMLSKTDAQYVPYEQVKPGIENLLKQQKGAEVLTKEIDKLKDKFKANINKDFFDRERKKQEQTAQKTADAANQQTMPTNDAPKTVKSA